MAAAPWQGYPGRMDHGWGARSDCQADLPQPPTHYLKTDLCRHCRIHTSATGSTGGTFGVDHVVMGTDYPFDMMEYDPIGHVASVHSFDNSIAWALWRQREEIT